MNWNPTAYDKTWSDMSAAGKDPHGEVAFVQRLIARRRLTAPAILDAGCGTGRVCIELAVRGLDVEGSDIDVAMLGHAAAKAPQLVWTLGNLATLSFQRHFDVIVMAGNVILFADVDERLAVVKNLCSQLKPDGHMVAGFQTARADRPPISLSDWDSWAKFSGMDLKERFSSWDDAPWNPGSDYVVTVHQRTPVSP